MPAIGGLSFRRSVSATAHFGLRRGLGGMCLCAKIPDCQETETGSTETRFDVALSATPPIRVTSGMTWWQIAKEFGLSFLTLLPLAGMFAALWGLLLGFPSPAR